MNDGRHRDRAVRPVAEGQRDAALATDNDGVPVGLALALARMVGMIWRVLCDERRQLGGVHYSHPMEQAGSAALKLLPGTACGRMAMNLALYSP